MRIWRLPLFFFCFVQSTNSTFFFFLLYRIHKYAPEDCLFPTALCNPQIWHFPPTLCNSQILQDVELPHRRKQHRYWKRGHQIHRGNVLSSHVFQCVYPQCAYFTFQALIMASGATKQHKNGVPKKYTDTAFLFEIVANGLETCLFIQ